MTVTALILAAGRSRRMGYPKAFLTVEGEPLLCRIVRTALAAGVDNVVLVVGAEKDPNLVNRRAVDGLLLVGRLADFSRLRIALGEPDRDPIASIRAGLRATPEGSAVLLWPVDHPFASSELVRALTRALVSPHLIVRPVVDDRGAHPVLFGPTVAPELFDSIADQGAHAVVHRDPNRLVGVPANDPRLIAALNTPADAQALGVERPPS